MKTLTINLEAPLQSYGNPVSFSRRTTSYFPSKSAVIGMLAAAMGFHREDQQILELNSLSFAIRIDQPGQTLSDFQTVEWKSGTRKITYRDYLQDAIFVVAISSEDNQLIDTLYSALKHPKFQLFLGRRSNPPAGPLKLQIFTDKGPIEVLKSLKWQASRWYCKKIRSNKVSIEIIADANLLPDRKSYNSMIKDQVISFDQKNRQLGFRLISKQRINLDNECFQNKLENTNHDIMHFI